MPTSRVISLYYTPVEMTRWKAFAISKGLLHTDGNPRVGAAIRELAQMGQETYMTRDVAGTVRLGFEQMLKLLAENVGGSRCVLLHLDKDGKFYDDARARAQKIYIEAMLPLAKRR